MARNRYTSEQAAFVAQRGPVVGFQSEALRIEFSDKFFPITLGALRNFGSSVRGGYRGADIAVLSAPAGTGYVPAPAPARPQHPTGWEPGLDTAKGTFTVASKSRDVTWDKELERLGFDPKEFEIVEPINVRTWEGFYKKPTEDGKSFTHEVVPLWYHKASITRRRQFDDRVDIDKLTGFIKAISKPSAKLMGTSGFSFNWFDAQIGKGDGDGTPGTVRRMQASLDAGVNRFNELQKLGRKLETIHFHIGADLYEATAGHYAMQTFSADLNLREQRAVARRLVQAGVTRFAGLGAKVVVTVVPGNHSENRLNGKAYTSFGDNGDLEIVEQVAEICAGNPDAYSNVTFVIPKEEMEITLDLHGTVLGLAHGHQMRQGVEKWWKDQMVARQPIGDADILITGHKHRAVIQRLGDRWHFQAPALESESTWFKHTNGDGGMPGVLTFVTANHTWSDLQIL